MKLKKLDTWKYKQSPPLTQSRDFNKILTVNSEIIRNEIAAKRVKKKK